MCEERDAEGVFGVPGYGSAKETAASGSFRECGWEYEQETYRGSE